MNHLGGPKMSDYNIKILELIGIEDIDNKYYLKINLTFEKTTEILLEVDEYTAIGIMNIVQFNNKNKYRLSFKDFYDDSKKQHLAAITKTFRDKSEILHFSCSKEYINKLYAIKNIEDINDLDKLSFVLREFPAVDKEIEFSNKDKYYGFSHISVAIIGLALILLFSQISHFYINKIDFNKSVLAESIKVDVQKSEEFEYELISYYNNHINNIEENLDLYGDESVEDENLIEKDENIENEISIENTSNLDNYIPLIELEGTVICSLPEGKVALTFDDGPSKYTKEIIDILKEYNVGGTFFLVGYNAEKYPDYVHYIHSNGYTIGSHSMNHLNMKKLPYEKQKNEVMDCVEALKKIIDEDIILFRPPYGSYNKQLIDLVTDHEYKVVLWNNDPEDWKTKDADKILESIKNSNTSGAIILLHESQAVVDSLPKIIEYLQEQNLEIVNLK